MSNVQRNHHRYVPDAVPDSGQWAERCWYLLGAGAIGSLWAHRLLSQGRDVRLILRNAQRLAQLSNAGGVTVVDDGVSRRQPCEGLLAGQLTESVDRLIIACKAQQSLEAFDSVRASLGDGAVVILLQNGMGVAEQLQQRRADLQLFCAITTSGAHLLSPFRVQLAGTGQTRLGRYPRDAEGSRSRRWADQLSAADLPVIADSHIYRTQWHKMALNCVINPLTALYGIRNGSLLVHAEAAQLAGRLCGEVAAVSAASAIALSRPQLLAAVEQVCQQTASNVSSMLQDVRQRRPTEVAYINGYLQRVARERGVDCPTNAALIARVRALEGSFR